MRTLTATLILMLATSSAALAGSPRGGGHHGPPPMRILNHADELGLSEEQVVSLEAIIEESKTEHEASRGELRELRRELRTLMESDQLPETSAVTSLAQSIGALETDMRELHLLTMLDVRAVLTPEQWTTLKSLRAERGERDGEPQRRRGRGPDKEVEGL